LLIPTELAAKKKDAAMRESSSSVSCSTNCSGLKWALFAKLHTTEFELPPAGISEDSWAAKGFRYPIIEKGFGKLASYRGIFNEIEP
jgi:hypothetical protein